MAMDNAPVAPIKDDGHGFQWIDIADFSPGCVSYTEIAGASTNLTDISLQIQGKFAADALQTFSCMALPTGGLGPLPSLTEVHDWPGSLHSINGYLVGMLAHGNLNSGDTEVFAAMEQDNGTNHYFEVFSYNAETSTGHSVISSTNTTTPGFFATPYMAMTRVNNTSPYTMPGGPTIAFPWSCITDANGDSGHLYIYPDPAATGAYGVADLVTAGSNVTGPVVTHQGRIITLSGIGYSFPPATFQTNEQICYTDPPNSNVYGFQQEIFVPEHPYGYGCAGSISAGELFLVKQKDGGLIASGDIAQATVTYLPGVQPTGAIYGNCGQTSIGLVYCSDGEGAWVWNGGNLSTKLSAQLDDKFFVSSSAVPTTENLGFYVEPWGNWIMFSNSWMYDITTSSWWRLYPAMDTAINETTLTLYDFFFFSQGKTTNVLWAGMPTINHTNEHFLGKFDKTVGSTQYQWTSLPIQVSEDRTVNIREFVIRAIDPANTGNAQLTITASSPHLSTPITVTTAAGEITATPANLRHNFNTGPVDNIIIQVSATNSGGAAPILLSLSVAYKTRQHSATEG
jgi:hypothetical protein